MLLVTVFQDSRDNIAAFEAEGHTDCAPRGEDIVCAGASAVIQAAVLGCVTLLGIRPGMEQEDGYLYFTVPDDLNLEMNEKVQVILKTMLLGLREMQRQHPDRIGIVEEQIGE